MTNKIVFTLLDGEKITLTTDSYLTCVKNDEDSLKEDNMFYSRIIYQDYPLNETSSYPSVMTSSPLVGMMGLLTVSDFFYVASDSTESADIDVDEIVVYKSSSIKNIGFK